MHENRETSSVPVEQTGRSEKALCRTADMYALEESDRCVVPMKQLNKEGQPSAEAVEGRRRPKENLHYLARVRLRAGNLCHRGRAECADSSTPLSKGRAVCGNSARTDLCGGRFVRIVPTATPNSFCELRSPVNSHSSGI